MFTFLRSINLEPIEWSEAVSFTGEASPFTGQILDRALSQAKAVVVLITGDDLARLGTRFQSASDPQHEKDFTPQARPNVLFEAGMAFGRQPERTILTSLGPGKPFSDVAGRNEVRISNRPGDRQALAGRLKTAGCAVKTDHKADWLTAGDFDAAILTPDNGTGDTETARRAPLAAVPVEAQQDENERRGR
jgi:predicted nucleotide-binding protein